DLAVAHHHRQPPPALALEGDHLGVLVVSLVVDVHILEANPVAEPAGEPSPAGEGPVSLSAAVVATVTGMQDPGSEYDHLHRACLAPAAVEGGGDEGAPARWHGASPLGHGTPSSVPSLTPSGYVR